METILTLTLILAKIVAIVAPLMLAVAYLTYAERKIIGYMQVRIGPNRVGPLGLLQPFADVIKLLIKEVVVPSRSNRFLFVAAPLLTLTPAFAAWAVISLWPGFSIANVDAGVLYILALAGFGAYGIILAGWATNSKYAFLGAMRTAAQIVAGFHVEYSGIAFALFFLSEYANMILISTLAATFFLGGWLSPFEGYPVVGRTFLAQPSLLWLVLKACLFLFCFLWFRATFPRYRYDQIMRLGWKVFIPLTLVWIGVECVMAWYRFGPWARL